MNDNVSYLDHRQTKGWLDNSVQGSFDAVLTASCFDMNYSNVAAVSKTLGILINNHVYEAIDRTFGIKDYCDMFNLKVSKNKCDYI